MIYETLAALKDQCLEFIFDNISDVIVFKDLCLEFIFDNISDVIAFKDLCLEFISEFIFGRLTNDLELEETITLATGTLHIRIQANVPNKDRHIFSEIIGRDLAQLKKERE